MKRAVLLVIVFVLCLLISPAQIHIQRGNLWDSCLQKNVETLLILFKDGTTFIVTAHMANLVPIPMDHIFCEGREPGDVVVIIHNHLDLSRWSEMDEATNRMFRRVGCRGAILLRLGSGKVIEWED